MPELIRFTTALILNPFNKICHAMVVSTLELAFYLNPAKHAVKGRHGSYKWIIMLIKCGRPDLTVFHLIWIIGIYGNWKNLNPGGRFGATS
jgi:hypothetical protein